MFSLRRKSSQRIPQLLSRLSFLPTASLKSIGQGQSHDNARATAIVSIWLLAVAFASANFIAPLKSFFTLRAHDPRRRLSGSRVADRVA
jgi:hypothetical protein